MEPVKACLGFGVMALISCITLLVMHPDDGMLFPVGIVLGVVSFVLVITGSIFYQKRKKRVIPLYFPGGSYVPSTEPLRELPPGALVNYMVG